MNNSKDVTDAFEKSFDDMEKIISQYQSKEIDRQVAMRELKAVMDRAIELAEK